MNISQATDASGVSQRWMGVRLQAEDAGLAIK
jgi:hypothetical protein